MPKFQVLKTFSDAEGNMVYTRREQKVFIEMETKAAKPFVDIGALKAAEKPKKSKES